MSARYLPRMAGLCPSSLARKSSRKLGSLENLSFPGEINLLPYLLIHDPSIPWFETVSSDNSCQRSCIHRFAQGCFSIYAAGGRDIITTRPSSAVTRAVATLPSRWPRSSTLLTTMCVLLSLSIFRLHLSKLWPLSPFVNPCPTVLEFPADPLCPSRFTSSAKSRPRTFSTTTSRS